MDKLPRKDLAAKAIENSKAILVDNQEDAIDLLNEYAAEHLILSVANAEEISERIINAGFYFFWVNYTPESCGDYASGTNHTLPTNGHARAYSGVSVDSFCEKDYNSTYHRRWFTGSGSGSRSHGRSRIS